MPTHATHTRGTYNTGYWTKRRIAALGAEISAKMRPALCTPGECARALGIRSHQAVTQIENLALGKIALALRAK